MSMFKEFLTVNKKEEPEVRKAGDIGRSDDTIRTKKGRKTSVSLGTTKVIMAVIGIVSSIAAVAAIIWVATKAIQIYIGG